MTRRSSTRWSALTVAATAMLFAACGDADEATSTSAVVAPASTTLEPVAYDELSAFVEFPRYLQLKRVVEVAITNAGTAPVQIDSVDLDSPLFSDLPADPVTVTIGPGRRRDLQYPLGDVMCDELEAPGQSAIARLGVDGGTDGDDVIELDLDPASLAAIADDECGRAHVFETASIGFGDEWTVDADVLTVPIVMHALGDEALAIEQVGSNVIFVVEATAPLPGTVDRVDATVSPSNPDEEVSLQIRAARCEPHAVTESKKTFVFPLWARVGDEDERYVTVEPDPPLHAALQGLIDDCQRALASVPK